MLDLKKALAIAVALITLFTLKLNFAVADSSSDFSLGISPTIIVVNANQPSSVDTKIKIQNDSTNVEDLVILLRPFKLSARSNGQIEYPPNLKSQGPDSRILEKVKIYDGDNDVNQIRLNPLASKTLDLKLNVDAGEPSGDYYFTVLFVSKSNITQESSSSSLGGIGTNVILSIGKKTGIKGSIPEFSTPFLAGTGPVAFTLLVSNDGDRYIEPRGRINLRDMFGRDQGFIEILPQYIPAHSKRYMIDLSQKPNPKVNLKTGNSITSRNPVMIWPSRFLFGVYTAEATVRLSETGPAFERTISFIALPFYLIFAFSLFAFVIIGIYIRVKRKI